MRVPPLGMGKRQPIHKVREVAVVPRPHHQMPVSGHEAVRQQSHLLPGARLRKHPLEGRIVLVFFEQRLMPIGPVQDVIHDLRRRDT
jgi:hypothetical protein